MFRILIFATTFAVPLAWSRGTVTTVEDTKTLTCDVHMESSNKHGKLMYKHISWHQKHFSTLYKDDRILREDNLYGTSLEDRDYVVTGALIEKYKAKPFGNEFFFCKKAIPLGNIFPWVNFIG